MDDRDHPICDPAIKQALELFEKWRRTKKHREPIPEHLWKAAVKLARNHPRSHVAKMLRLDYSDLKSRIEKLETDQTLEKDKSVFRFWEITPPSDGAQPHRHVSTPDRKCVVEMVSRFGDQMRIHFSAGATIDLPRLTRSFLRGRK
jgi:hypothetical protein